MGYHITSDYHVGRDHITTRQRRLAPLALFSVEVCASITHQIAEPSSSDNDNAENPKMPFPTRQSFFLLPVIAETETTHVPESVDSLLRDRDIDSKRSGNVDSCCNDVAAEKGGTMLNSE